MTPERAGRGLCTGLQGSRRGKLRTNHCIKRQECSPAPGFCSGQRNKHVHAHARPHTSTQSLRKTPVNAEGVA